MGVCCLIPAASLPYNDVLRFVQYNGGLGPEQLRWFEDELAEASRAGQRVVAFGHTPIHPAATDERALMWNYDEVSSGCSCLDGTVELGPSISLCRDACTGYASIR